jgi:hypothetical protein
MATKKSNNIPPETIELYKKLIETVPMVELKGVTMPYVRCKRRTTESADINRQKRRTKMPTLRKIKRGVLPTHLPTQKHHI